MIKHRGFPSRLPGSDYQFTIRRAAKSKVTKLMERQRFADRKHSDKVADKAFIRAVWEHFGDGEFERGNLDAGRLSWFLGREIKSVGSTFDPSSYDTKLVLDKATTSNSFPDIFENND
ncbi:hypothetical protein N9J96_09125 [Paracoccaceae bacterium]|jgi:hypothetical protein|nr:hypothetical protein [Paracoccaceae bacterium]MDA9123650.1 hypothetical protein [Paracoccaceae bacterium]|tara:strand:- start:1703 stop:2056 length:354 start_codon:yes stop_codon:yes gene_type:complete